MRSADRAKAKQPATRAGLMRDTVITVAKVSGGALGIFAIKDGRASCVPAVDATRVAMMGILVGLLSAVLAGVAMVRRPPWPDLHGDISTRH